MSGRPQRFVGHGKLEHAPWARHANSHTPDLEEAMGRWPWRPGRRTNMRQGEKEKVKPTRAKGVTKEQKGARKALNRDSADP